MVAELGGLFVGQRGGIKEGMARRSEKRVVAEEPSKMLLTMLDPRSRG